MAAATLATSMQAAGLRLTRARQAVLQVLEGNPRQHLSAQDIQRLSGEQGCPVDLASVYRTINTLVSLGLVHRSDLSESHTHFELEHREEVHLTCRLCGRVIEGRFPGHQRLERVLARLAGAQGFAPLRFRVEVEGACRHCCQERREGRADGARQ